MTSPRPSQPPEGTGLLLHLAGPMQSWGEHSRFNQRDTARFPTRSGIIGLLAAALGRRRGESLDDLARLSLTTRVDRPGVLLRDYHTVGGGLPAKATVTTASGGKRKPSDATLVSTRYYLADAAFTTAVTGEDAGLLRDCAAALRNPVWPPYLGRRSCPPSAPLLIGGGTAGRPLVHLVQLPLAAPPPRAPDTANVPIDFYGDQRLDHLTSGTHTPAGPYDGLTPVGEVNDDPIDLSPQRRTYRARPLYQRTIPLPAAQYSGFGTDYLASLTDYLHQHAADFHQEAAAS